MVIDNILRDTEPGYDLVKNEQGSSFPIIVKCQLGFKPLSKVVYCYNDIAMHPGRNRLTCSEINPPLGEGTDNNNWKHRS
jgi:hypothetical protein